MNTFPENCTVCPYGETCQSFFGAKGCEFEEEIRKAILKTTDSQEHRG